MKKLYRCLKIILLINNFKITVCKIVIKIDGFLYLLIISNIFLKENSLYIVKYELFLLLVCDFFLFIILGKKPILTLHFL